MDFKNSLITWYGDTPVFFGPFLRKHGVKNNY